MALKIKLQRGGATHNPVYRVVVSEARGRRDGRFVEKLGTYIPRAKGQQVELTLNVDRADYWMSVGAKPTDTANSLIKRARKEAPVAAEA
ncbi:MAG: 30S ribosomal protein S16 [Opitutales bacterium TMED158]|nr:MAG: 30S ribosomal protein S16 [Opitutales bacterium TMED158]